MHRLINDRSSLLPALRSIESMKPPFYDAEIASVAFDEEVRNIYENARPSTKRIYDMGEAVGQEHYLNPIIRWMLRYVLASRSRHG